MVGNLEIRDQFRVIWKMLCHCIKFVGFSAMDFYYLVLICKIKGDKSVVFFVIDELIVLCQLTEELQRE